MRKVLLALLVAASPTVNAATASAGFGEVTISFSSAVAGGTPGFWIDYEAYPDVDLGGYFTNANNFEGEQIDAPPSPGTAWSTAAGMASGFSWHYSAQALPAFYLSPFTTMTVSATAYLDRKLAAGESGAADAVLGIEMHDTTTGAPLWGDGAADALTFTGTDATSLSRMLTASVTAGPSLALAQWSQSVYVSVDAGAVAPVPEPETYALMAMGLGAVLWQVKRRKHREGCHSLA